MNQPWNTTSEPQTSAVQTIPWSQTFYWTVRRELWEYRSTWIAPLAAAALVLAGYTLSFGHLGDDVRGSASMNEFEMPYTHAGWVLMATALFVGIAYSIGSLQNERRDRSILFWKSLPVSDLITVLAKASIPLVLLPVLVVLLTVVLQLLMLVLSTIALALTGGGASTLWALPWIRIEVPLFYEMIGLGLWLAPVYGWLLLVSAWARRAAVLWAVLPPLGLAVMERIAFGTDYIFLLLKDRTIGFVTRGFHRHLSNGDMINPHVMPLAMLTPGRLLASASFWLGLAATAAMIYAAAELRRTREPF